MYHLLVAGNAGAWDLPDYHYQRDRVGEYSTFRAEANLKSLSASAIEEFKIYPALFAYEGKDHPWRVGYIRSIKLRGGRVHVQYEFDSGIPEIPFSSIEPLMVKLHIELDEVYRTHWAVKDKDLFDILEAAGLFHSFVRPSVGRVEDMRFKVALSFPGEVRGYVSDVARELRNRLSSGTLFYDNDFQAQLAKPNLDTLLQRIYRENSELVVVFLCADYETKPWCGIEWRAIREIIIDKNDHAVMFMRFDNAKIQGVFSHDGYIDANRHTAAQVAAFILERVRLNNLSKILDSKIALRSEAKPPRPMHGTVQNLIVRLKAAGELESIDEYQAGFDAGQAWAQDMAPPGELNRMSAYIANFDSRLDWWDVDYLGWNAPFGATDYFVFEVWPERYLDRGAPDEFWEQALGDLVHRVQNSDFFHGFGDGADDVWQQVKDQL